MQEVTNASPVLPVAAAAPVQANASTAASQGNDGQAAFAQVLRDKQAAAAATANATANAETAKAGKAADKTSNADGKADAKPETDATTTEVVAKTPAEMAQLLAAAGLLANTSNAPVQPADAGASDATADQLASLATLSAASDTASKAAADSGAMTSASANDKAAATGAAATASLAANTANVATTAEQALAAQARSDLGSKDARSGTGSGDQQAADKQPLIPVATQAETDKSRVEAANAENSFAAALERAGQTGDTAHAGVTAAANTASTQSAHAPAVAHTVNTPVGRQGWADEVGQRVLWTAKSDSNRADLVLTPPQLGRIEVSIHMNGDQASASFMVANPVAREALQDAMPRLRELMSQAGIQLGQADVSAGQSGQNSAQGERRQTGNGLSGGMLGADGAIGTTAGGWTRQGTGLVDTFA